jgi:hypothetical protein
MMTAYDVWSRRRREKMGEHYSDLAKAAFKPFEPTITNAHGMK